MLPSTLLKGFDRGRLKTLLAVFFLALAVPTGLLIWQAYGQLKWEAFHQYRGQAEELTGRINVSLARLVDSAEARSFAEYSFLVVSGDPSANFLQPSALSAYPVSGEPPGVIGHFQVDSDGRFSTPLLPSGAAEAALYGIGPDEYRRRQEVANQVRTILGDNRLVQSRVTHARAPLLSAAAVAAEESAETAAVADQESRGGASGQFRRQDGRAAAVANERISADADAYSQSVFDELNEPASFNDATDAPKEAKKRDNSLGRVEDLKLSAELQRKSEAAELAKPAAARQVGLEPEVPQAARAKRLEKDAIAEIGGSNIRIGTFESEIDPFEFSLLDSGHLVLFRKVWHDGERFIQGLLIDQRSFIDAAVDRQFRGTGLSQMCDVIVAYEDDVIRTISGQADGRYSTNASDLQGSLLYQARLAAPFDHLSLIYSVNRLPPGPGASVLGWVTLVLAAVFLGGFYALYRVGLSQINLASQQRDFVSAVSHELKTPLTSIRMYGEMLKDGWADEKKRQQYYEYIHDESERLTRLISNVLQLASITRNEPQLDMKPTRVDTLLDQVQAKISNQVERAGFGLMVARDARVEDILINIDHDCFAQIIINLVDNAIKFSRQSGTRRIEIGARRNSDSQLAFSVRDFGPGIPKDQMKKIFKLFYRTESELTRETVGTGIGLAIVHQLSIAMGGSVDVVNTNPGAEFRVSFPATGA